MPFIKAIEEFRSVSIVGMAKNTGKTTCLNYVLRRLCEEQAAVAVTSIGVDGEERDILYDTPKPRIVLQEGMVFVTAEKDFEAREFSADVLAISERSTPLGRLVTARAKDSGKVVLSGPSDSQWMQEMITVMPEYGVTITLVDGALSRMSLASPAVTDAMVLCTGAACSAQLPELIRHTKFRCGLIDLPQVEALDEKVFRIKSVFTYTGTSTFPDTVYVEGAVTDSFLKQLSAQMKGKITLIVNDFTRLFIQPLTYDIFTRRGGIIKVLQKAKLLAVCTNPVSPEGRSLDPYILKEQMQEALQLPVYDIMMHEK